MSLVSNPLNPFNMLEAGWKMFFPGKCKAESSGSARPRGLVNMGNTCFLNSVLQAASSCPHFVTHVNYVSSSTEGGQFVHQLSQCLTDLRSGGFYSGPVHPNKLLKLLALHNPEFGGFNEQDALEAFESILSCLKEENEGMIKGIRESSWHKMLNISHSIVPSRLLSTLPNSTMQLKIGSLVCPFEGWMSSQLQCQACRKTDGEQSLRWMPARHQVFTTLPLPISAPQRMSGSARHNSSIRSSAEDSSEAVNLKGGNPVGGVGRFNAMTGSIESTPTIYSCLQEFFRAEDLSGIACSACSSAATISNMQRQLSVAQRKAARETSKDTPDTLRLSSPDEVNSDTWASSVIVSALADIKKLRVVGGADAYIQDFDTGFVSILSPLTNKVEQVKRAALVRQHSGGSPNSVATPRGGPYSPSEVTAQQDRELLLLSLKQQAHSDAVKCTALSRLPSLLCLYLCRRVYDESKGKMKKILQHVSFPVVLNMDQFCGTDSAAKAAHKTAAPVSSVSAMLSGGLSQQLGGMKVSARSCEYLLRAVVEHRGNAETGHYVAYCLVQEQPQRVWELFSDEKHAKVTEADVLAAQATMLFYDRVPTR